MTSALHRHVVTIHNNMLAEPVRVWPAVDLAGFGNIARAVELRTGKQLVVLKDCEAGGAAVVERVGGEWVGRMM